MPLPYFGTPDWKYYCLNCYTEISIYEPIYFDTKCPNCNTLIDNNIIKTCHKKEKEKYHWLHLRIKKLKRLNGFTTLS